jgi:hypothetical protein
MPCFAKASFLNFGLMALRGTWAFFFSGRPFIHRGFSIKQLAARALSLNGKKTYKYSETHCFIYKFLICRFSVQSNKIRLLSEKKRHLRQTIHKVIHRYCV